MSSAMQMPTSSRKFWLTTILKTTVFTGVLSFTLLAQAQVNASLYGTGVLGGSNACGYKVEVGDEAQSTLDDIADKKKDIERIDQDIKDKTSDLKDATDKMREAKRTFYDAGYRESGDIGSMVTRFIESNKTCSSVVSFDSAPAPTTDSATSPAPAPGSGPTPDSVLGRKDNDGKSVAGTSDADKKAAEDAKKNGDKRKLEDAKPLNAQQFKSVCSEADGTINGNICDNEYHFEGSVGRDVDISACRSSLKDWEDSQKEVKKLHDEVDAAKRMKASENRKLQTMNRKANREIGDYLKEQASGGSEGDVCYTCLLQGNQNAVRTSQNQNTGAEILAQLGLGIGSMIIGGQTDRYNAKTSAMLGYQYQSTPSFAYGFPYFMGAMYGAISGGLSAGGFGCGSTIGGGGNAGGNINGMLSPLGLAGLGGNVGGAFGYPQSYYPNNYGGGLFNTGMGNWGQNGPWGLSAGNGLNGIGNGIYGIQNPYGLGVGNGYGSPYGNMGGGFNLGGSPFGGMGNGYPGMGNGFGSPYGNLGGGFNLGGSPYSGYPGMGNGYPGMGNGYPGFGSPYGNLGGGFNLGGSPYGMPSMYSPYGNMGSYSPYGMNNGNNMLAMQQYQMQMQQYQQQMQMQQMQQQRYQQAQYAGQQVVGQLYQQIQSLYGQIQSVQASLQTYGTIPSYYMGAVNGGSGAVGVGVGVGIGVGTGYSYPSYYNGGYYQGGGSIAPAGSVINNGQTNPVTTSGPNIR